MYIVWLQFEKEARKTLSAGRGLPIVESAPPKQKYRKQNQDIENLIVTLINSSPNCDKYYTVRYLAKEQGESYQRNS